MAIISIISIKKFYNLNQKCTAVSLFELEHLKTVKMNKQKVSLNNVSDDSLNNRQPKLGK